MTIGLGLLLASGRGLYLRWSVARVRAAVPTGAASLPVPRAETPFGRSMAAAVRLYLRAEAASARRLDAVGEWDPNSLNGSAPEQYRRALMARSAELGQAESAAREAAQQAADEGELYRAVLLLARIHCDLGQHRSELVEARQLVTLRPRDPEALQVLRRAVECNGQAAPARRADILATKTASERGRNEEWR